MNLIADPSVYEQILPKQDIKATVSGLYITSFKRIQYLDFMNHLRKRRDLAESNICVAREHIV